MVHCDPLSVLYTWVCRMLSDRGVSKSRFFGLTPLAPRAEPAEPRRPSPRAAIRAIRLHRVHRVSPEWSDRRQAAHSTTDSHQSVHPRTSTRAHVQSLSPAVTQIKPPQRHGPRQINGARQRSCHQLRREKQSKPNAYQQGGKEARRQGEGFEGASARSNSERTNL